MKKHDSVLLRVFLYGLPVVALFAVFCHFYSTGNVSPDFRFLNSLGGLVFAVWMALSVYLSVRLMISEPFRDHVLIKLALMRERDEREVMITGRATRTTFLASLAVLVFLFCLSCFHVSIYRVSPEKAIDGRTGVISLGIGFNVFESPASNKTAETVRQQLFIYKGLPLTTPAVILMLILWQIVFYNYSVRRLGQ